MLDPDLVGEYAGGCRDGLAEGYGTARGAGFYQGQFHQGRKHGKGVKTWPNGDRYEGEFRDDRRDGVGRYTWGAKTPWAGDSYAGGYRQDKRHGQGVYEWASGDRYAGLWQDDLRYGPSAMEIQKQRALTAWMAAAGKPGTVVCAEVPYGLALREKIRGRVVRVVGDQVEVSLNAADDPRVVAGGGGGSEKIVRRAFFDWRLCE